MFRNPFDTWTDAPPKPKKFGMPNQSPSVQNRMLSQSNPWRETIFNDTMTNPMPSQTQSPTQPGNEWGGYLSEMRDLYTKQGPSQQAYEQHLQNLPQYEKPGGWHRFGSALVGAATGLQQGAGAGWKAGQEALNLPHQRAMEEWSTREQGLGRQAEMEDKSTARKLSYMKEVRELAKDDQDYRKMMREFENKDRQFQADEAYRDAQIQNWRDQGYRETINDAGETIFVNPRTKEKYNAGKSSKVGDWAREDRRIRDQEKGTNIQGYVAQTGRMNYGLGERAQDRLEREEMNRPVSPSDQSDAGKSAIAQAQGRRPEYVEFVTPEGGINEEAMKLPLSDPKRALFNRFMLEVNDIKEEILRRRRETTYKY
jgi:hypothetical protein